MPDRMKLRLSIANEQHQKMSTPIEKVITHKQAIAHIKSKNFEPDLMTALVKRISRYPANSLNAAMKRLPEIVVEITAQLRKEAQDAEPDARIQNNLHQPIPNPDPGNARPSPHGFQSSNSPDTDRFASHNLRDSGLEGGRLQEIGPGTSEEERSQENEGLGGADSDLW